MHINASYLRIGASHNINRLFSTPSETASSANRTIDVRFSDDPDQSSSLRYDRVRKAVRKIIEILDSRKTGAVTTITAQQGDYAYKAIKGSSDNDHIVFTEAGNQGRSPDELHAGDGDDTISFTSRIYSNTLIRAGNGNDTVAVAAASSRRIHGEDGNDAISVSAKEAGTVYGGAGNDLIAIAGEYVSGARGGDGDDTIAVSGEYVSSVQGGNGDDSIAVSSNSAHYQRINGRVAGYDIIANEIIGVEIEGGAGNDTIVIDGEAQVLHRKGGGQDVVTISNRTSFVMLGDDFYDETMDLKNATFSNEDGAIIVSYEGRDEKLTIRSASGGPLTLEIVEDEVFDRTFVVTPG